LNRSPRKARWGSFGIHIDITAASMQGATRTDCVREFVSSH
jgi:hypothetical protein